MRIERLVSGDSSKEISAKSFLTTIGIVERGQSRMPLSQEPIGMELQGNVTRVALHD